MKLIAHFIIILRKRFINLRHPRKQFRREEKSALEDFYGEDINCEINLLVLSQSSSTSTGRGWCKEDLLGPVVITWDGMFITTAEDSSFLNPENIKAPSVIIVLGHRRKRTSSNCTALVDNNVRGLVANG